MLNIDIILTSEHSNIPVNSKGSAGYDLYSVEEYTIPPLTRQLVKTGIKIAIPDGYYGHISDRSGWAYKHGAHCLGKIIDSTYRGEVGVIIYNTSNKDDLVVKIGDRIAQIIFKKYEEAEFNKVEVLQNTIRGEGGYGSTGK